MPDSSISASALSASVDAASSPPASSTSSRLWPFPDLALLHLDELLEHPCALLDVQGPLAGGEWLTWGFSEREQGVLPQGSPASFHLEGSEDDGYLKLKGGEAAPGLSGAPLVCPRRRAVVAVVVASRQLHSDLGGYATPVASLLGNDKRLPADVAAHGALVRAMNVRAVVDDGRTWHRVLQDQGMNGVLNRPWASFVKGDGSSPSDLLRPEFGVVPYLFRQTALQQAIAWCHQDRPFAIARVLGDVGSGKTRFALELCKLLCDRGWMAGFWRRDKASADIARPRLVVVEFAEVDELRLALEAVNDLSNSASEIAPVRVLLLTRTGADGQLPEPVRDEAPASLVNVLASDLVIDRVSAALGISQREELYNAAVRAFVTAWQSTSASETQPDGRGLDPPDLSNGRYAAPLEVLFEALDFALGGEQSAYGRFRSPVERVLERERRYWQRSGPQLSSGLQEAVAALSTLTGAVSDEEARALLEVLPALRGVKADNERRRLIDWHRHLYGGPGILNPVRPDRLGEVLVSQFLRNQADGGSALVEALLSLSSDSQVAHCLDVLAHLVTSAQGHKSGSTSTSDYESIRASLVRCSDDLKRRALHARDRPQLPNPIAGAYERLTEALGVIERRQGLQRREALAQDQVADERAREEQTSREYSNSVKRRDQLAGLEISEMMTSHALPPAQDPKVARERTRLNQRIDQLEGELVVVRQARQVTEDELDRLRSERVDLDKLIAFKLELEEQLRRQVRHVNDEHRRREEADERRKQAEKRGDITQQQLETQFLRAQYEAFEREKAERKLLAAQGKIRELGSDWDLQSSTTRHDLELGDAIELLHKKAWQTITELQRQLARLQEDRRKLLTAASAVGVIAGAVLVSILILIIN